MVVQDRNPNAVKKPTELERQQKNDYYCPVYKYPKRSDKYLIFRLYMRAEAPVVLEPGQKASNKEKAGDLKPAQNWKLKGVALLCCKEWAMDIGCSNLDESIDYFLYFTLD